MTTALIEPQKIQYHTLFPDWRGPRPLEFFLMENLLEARHHSTFPTNGAGPDEEVNVYLVHLLANFLNGRFPAEIRSGVAPLTRPPSSSLSRRQRADYYRQNADHRLLMLGLFRRGDHLRPHARLWGLGPAASEQQDIAVGHICYQMAANLLENRLVGEQSLVPIWQKLAANFELYTQVLGTLATRQLGLGASLSDRELELLMVDRNHQPSPEAGDMDRLLDLLLELRQPGGQEKRAEVIDLALRLNLDPREVLDRAV